MAEEMYPESAGTNVRTSEENFATDCLYPPAEPWPSASSPCGSFLHLWFLLQSVEEGNWYYLCM